MPPPNAVDSSSLLLVLILGEIGGDRGRQREAEGDRGRQRETGGDRGRQRETEGDRGRHRETEGDRERQGETEGDRGRQRETGEETGADLEGQTILAEVDVQLAAQLAPNLHTPNPLNHWNDLVDRPRAMWHLVS